MTTEALTESVVSDVPTDAELDRQNRIADSWSDTILANLPEDVDAIGVAYAMWVKFIYVLVGAGWTTENLTKDVEHHAAAALELESDADDENVDGSVH